MEGKRRGESSPHHVNVGKNREQIDADGSDGQNYIYLFLYSQRVDGRNKWKRHCKREQLR